MVSSVSALCQPVSGRGWAPRAPRTTWKKYVIKMDESNAKLYISKNINHLIRNLLMVCHNTKHFEIINRYKVKTLLMDLMDLNNNVGGVYSDITQIDREVERLLRLYC